MIRIFSYKADTGLYQCIRRSRYRVPVYIDMGWVSSPLSHLITIKRTHICRPLRSFDLLDSSPLLLPVLTRSLLHAHGNGIKLEPGIILVLNSHDQTGRPNFHYCNLFYLPTQLTLSPSSRPFMCFLASTTNKILSY